MRVHHKGVGAGVLVACAALLIIVAVLYARPAAGAKPPGAADPAVVAAWNAIAVSTITGAPPDGVGGQTPRTSSISRSYRQPFTTPSSRSPASTSYTNGITTGRRRRRRKPRRQLRLIGF